MITFSIKNVEQSGMYFYILLAGEANCKIKTYERI